MGKLLLKEAYIARETAIAPSSAFKALYSARDPRFGSQSEAPPSADEALATLRSVPFRSGHLESALLCLQNTVLPAIDAERVMRQPK